MTTTTAATTTTTTANGGALRAVLVLEVVALVFTFVQFFTSSEFIRTKGASGDAWQEVHGFTAYGLLVPALLAAVVAIARLRVRPGLTAMTVLLFVASVGQWGSGHLISQFGQDGWTPFHVFFSSVVLALVVATTVRAAQLLRA